MFRFWAMGVGCQVYTIRSAFLRTPHAGWKEKPINLKMCYKVVGAVTDR